MVDVCKVLLRHMALSTLFLINSFPSSLAKAIAGNSQQFQFSHQLARISAGDVSLAGGSSGAGSSPGSLSLLSLISVWGIQG